MKGLLLTAAMAAYAWGTLHSLTPCGIVARYDLTTVFTPELCDDRTRAEWGWGGWSRPDTYRHTDQTTVVA